jgi:hypothetical protein
MSSALRTRSSACRGTKGNLPNLVILGAQKCGTTSLHYYLGHHPEIAMSKSKELNFFVATGAWNKGVEWYASQFDPSAPVRGEASPSYTNHPHHADVGLRMHSVVPAAKLVYLVRDPIERIVSQYLHDVSRGAVNRSLEDVLTNEPATHPYVLRSKYAYQLDEYLPFFPLSQILVLAQEELLFERQKTLRSLFEFIEVSDRDFYDPRFARIKHRTSAHRRRRTPLGRAAATVARAASSPLDVPERVAWRAERLLVFPFSRRLDRPVVGESLRRRLGAVFVEDVARLRELTGKTFPEWSL